MQIPIKNITVDRVFSTDTKPRKTKIICTIGPACDTEEKIIELIDAGLNVARLNFSHGDHTSKRKTINTINSAKAKRPNQQVALLLDTKGPEIRTGFLENPNGVHLNKGEHVEIVTDYEFKGTSKTIACSYEKLPQTVNLGDSILVADGSLVMKVVKINEDSVVVEMMNSGKLGEKKNMNLPGNKVDLPTVTAKDIEDIKEFAKDVDFIAVSFVQRGDDIKLVREALGPEGKHVKTIAKIENQEGLHNIDDIIDSFDAIMVARGDMGMEIPMEKVFLAQKMIIRKCNLAGKPVITATQMLESMISNPRPTRAESTDVANAVLDGTDAVMLSGETANGNYGVEAVTIMSSICVEAESIINYENHFHRLMNSQKKTGYASDDSSSTSTSSKSSQMKGKDFTLNATGSGAVKMLIESSAKIIIVCSDQSDILEAISNYRPSEMVLFVTKEEKLAQQVGTLWSTVQCLVVKGHKSSDLKAEMALEIARNNKWTKVGDLAILVKEVKGSRYTLEVETV